MRDLGDREGEAEVLNSMATLIAHTAGPREALPHYRTALAIAREINSPADEAHALEGLARILARTGKLPAAVALLRDAVPIYRKIDAPEAKAAEHLLAELEQGGSAV